MAGHAAAVRPVAVGVRAAPPLAARWHLGRGRDRAAGPAEVLGQLAGEPELGQLLARALIYRLITEVVMRAGTPGIEAAARAAAPVTDLVTAYCCA